MRSTEELSWHSMLLQQCIGFLGLMRLGSSSWHVQRGSRCGHGGSGGGHLTGRNRDDVGFHSNTDWAAADQRIAACQPDRQLVLPGEGALVVYHRLAAARLDNLCRCCARPLDVDAEAGLSLCGRHLVAEPAQAAVFYYGEGCYPGRWSMSVSYAGRQCPL